MSALYHSAEEQTKPASAELCHAMAWLLLSSTQRPSILVNDPGTVYSDHAKVNFETNVLILTIALCKNY